jgi:hypothetical protein
MVQGITRAACLAMSAAVSKCFNGSGYLRKIVLSALLSFMCAGLAFAAQPKFTMVPTTPTTLTVAANQTATVQYEVTNKTKITRTLTTKPIAGVSQSTTGAGVCSTAHSR